MDAVTLPGTLDALSPIRDYVKAAAASAGLDHTATYNLLLAVDEIATNVVLHGYEEAGLQGDISIAATHEDNASGHPALGQREESTIPCSPGAAKTRGSSRN